MKLTKIYRRRTQKPSEVPGMEEAISELLRKYWDDSFMLQGLQEKVDFPEYKATMKERRKVAKDKIESLLQRKEELKEEISEIKLPTLAELKKMYKDPMKGFEDDRREKKKPEVKIVIKESEIFRLFEMPTVAVDKTFDYAQQVIKDNENYLKYLSLKDKKHRDDRGVQTLIFTTENKSTQTKPITQKTKGLTASAWDMYDSYCLVEEIDEEEKKVKSFEEEEEKEEEKNDEDVFTKRQEMERQNTYRMIFERVIASNVYKEQQQIYESKSVGVKDLTFNISELWVYDADELSEIGPVTAITWNPMNRMLVAAGYGAGERGLDGGGALAVWCIKNPENPERLVRTRSAVTGLAFSCSRPYLLAASCLDGALLLLNVASSASLPVPLNAHKLGLWSETLCAVKWYLNRTGCEDHEQIITVGLEGQVYAWDLEQPINSHPILDLSSAPAPPEKLKRTQAGRNHYAGLDIAFHLSEPMTFYVATDLGPILVCNVGSGVGPTRLLVAHEAAVYGVRPSPFCPQVIASFGVSEHVLVWVQTIDQPILRLTMKTFSVEDVDWSPSHSSLLACVTKENLYLWDLQRSALNPVRAVRSAVPQTTVKFSPWGNNLLVGNEEGAIIVYHLSEMPHEPCVQKDWLVNSLTKCLRMDKDLCARVDYLLQDKPKRRTSKERPKEETSPASSCSSSRKSIPLNNE